MKVLLSHAVATNLTKYRCFLIGGDHIRKRSVFEFHMPSIMTICNLNKFSSCYSRKICSHEQSSPSSFTPYSMRTFNSTHIHNHPETRESHNTDSLHSPNMTATLSAHVQDPTMANPDEGCEVTASTRTRSASNPHPTPDLIRPQSIQQMEPSLTLEAVQIGTIQLAPALKNRRGEYCLEITTFVRT